MNPHHQKYRDAVKTLNLTDDAMDYYELEFDELNEHSRYLGKSGRRLATDVAISPGLAYTLVTRRNAVSDDDRNRTIKWAHLNSLVASIEAGQWNPFGGRQLSFDQNGYIIDGQHRLMAVVAAGKPLVFDLMFNVPRETMDFIDSGVRRSSADDLSRRGYDRCTDRVKFARLLKAHDNRGWFYKAKTSRQGELDAAINVSDRFDRASEFVTTERNSDLPNIFGTSVRFAYFDVISRFAPEDKVAEFLNGLVLGRSEQWQTARDRIARANTLSGINESLSTVYVTVVTLWNIWATKDFHSLSRNAIQKMVDRALRKYDLQKSAPKIEAID